jgi:tetratricopeptide (TPR) repeat protein
VTEPNQQRRAVSPAQAFEAAVALHRGGLLADAEQFYRTILAKQPDHFGALYYLGLLTSQTGRFDEAVGLLQRALAAEPNGIETYNGLGIALAGLGRHAEAIVSYEKAIALNPRFAEAHNNLGLALAALGRHEEAIPRYETALAYQSDYVEASGNLGSSLASLDRHDKAIPHFEHLLSVRPDSWEGRINLGRALTAIKREAEALPHLRAALELRPDHAETHLFLGIALTALEREAEAIGYYERAAELQPDLAEAHAARGSALTTLGRLDEAHQAYETALALAPSRTSVHRRLAMAKHFAPGDRQLQAMEDLARNIGALEEEQKIGLYFALGKAYADLGDQARAFGHLAQGNALKRRRISYDERMALAVIARIRQAFTAELIERKSGIGVASNLPVFIVGMPRAGTTLVEQILASHPQVFGGGERHDFSDALAELIDTESPSSPILQLIQSLDRDKLSGIAERYLAASRALAPDAARVTDKMPANFRFAGLIHLALPGARIINVRRDPVDNCMACFSQSFADDNQAFSYDLGELGRYYRAYSELMDHWRDVLPKGVLLDVQYEDLVADFEVQARRIVAHCGLDWDERCLAFHETERRVKTASAAQVRQPLYKSAVGRWQPYKDMLKPLLDELGGGAKTGRPSRRSRAKHP